MEYRVNKLQFNRFIFIPLAKLYGAIVIFLLLSLYLFEVKPEHVYSVSLITLAWVSLIHIMPLLIIGGKHYIRSKGVVLSFEEENDSFEYRKDGIVVKFRTEDVARITKVVSSPTYGNRLDVLGFGYFYYWKIYLREGAMIPVSCMLVRSDRIFAGCDVSLEKQVFPIPPSYSQ